MACLFWLTLEPTNRLVPEAPDQSGCEFYRHEETHVEQYFKLSGTSLNQTTLPEGLELTRTLLRKFQ